LIKCSNSNTQIQKSETFLCSLWSLFLSWVVSDTSDTRAQKIIEPFNTEGRESFSSGFPVWLARAHEADLQNAKKELDTNLKDKLGYKAGYKLMTNH